MQCPVNSEPAEISEDLNEDILSYVYRGLSPHTQYTFRVYTLSAVMRDRLDEANYVQISAKTQSEGKICLRRKEFAQ